MATFIVFIGSGPKSLLDDVILFDADNPAELNQQAQAVLAGINRPAFYGEIYNVASGVKVSHFVRVPEPEQEQQEQPDKSE